MITFDLQFKAVELGLPAKYSTLITAGAKENAVMTHHEDPSLPVS